MVADWRVSRQSRYSASFPAGPEFASGMVQGRVSVTSHGSLDRAAEVPSGQVDTLGERPQVGWGFSRPPSGSLQARTSRSSTPATYRDEDPAAAVEALG